MKLVGLKAKYTYIIKEEYKTTDVLQNNSNTLLYMKKKTNSYTKNWQKKVEFNLKTLKIAISRVPFYQKFQANVVTN